MDERWEKIFWTVAVGAFVFGCLCLTVIALYEIFPVAVTNGGVG